jgi:hypothetical protein
MVPDTQTTSVAIGKLRTGRFMSALPALFLLVNGAMKPEPVVKATVELDYAEEVILALGFVLLGCMIVYLIPQTSVLGAILLMSYLAVPSQPTYAWAMGRCRSPSQSF